MNHTAAWPVAAADKIPEIIWTIKIVLAMMSTAFRNREIRDALNNRSSLSKYVDEGAQSSRHVAAVGIIKAEPR
jgi:hypothetical protein